MMKRLNKPIKRTRTQKYDGDIKTTFSTGSTLLDLAISGGRKRGGGVPAGILVEVFGPSQSGKTVLLCELAGAVKRKGGAVRFDDPEARLDRQFAKMFDLNVDEISYSRPDQIPDVFKPIRNWDVDYTKVNGAFIDSLAALSTDLEMEAEDGDKMGMRRAKLFSQEFRKTCRIIAERNLLLVMSNQLRENIGITHGEKYKSPGGHALEFYTSLRLRFSTPEKIKKKKTIQGKEVFRIVGVKTNVQVFKSSVWSPYRIAPLTIYFDYGIDDVRQNLQFIKDYTKHKVYTLRGKNLSKEMDKAIQMIEEGGWEKRLRREVIELWEIIEEKFKVERKAKRR